MVKRWDSKTKEVATIQVFDWRFRFDYRQNRLLRTEPRAKLYHDKDGKLESATAHIKKICRWSLARSFGKEAFFEEYFQEKIILFGKMPRLMLAKTAEALVLRRAFRQIFQDFTPMMKWERSIKPSCSIPHAKPLPPVQLHKHNLSTKKTKK